MNKKKIVIFQKYGVAYSNLHNHIKHQLTYKKIWYCNQKKMFTEMPQHNKRRTKGHTLTLTLLFTCVSNASVMDCPSHRPPTGNNKVPTHKHISEAKKLAETHQTQRKKQRIGPPHRTLSNWTRTWMARSGLRVPLETISSSVSVKHIPIVDRRYNSKVAIFRPNSRHKRTLIVTSQMWGGGDGGGGGGGRGREGRLAGGGWSLP